MEEIGGAFKNIKGADLSYQHLSQTCDIGNVYVLIIKIETQVLKFNFGNILRLQV